MPVPENPPSPRPAHDARERAYRPELDAIRFLAFLLVFFFHVCSYASVHSSHWHLLASLAVTGAAGLCLFFALSAFLITEILLAEREKSSRISVRKFYIRRILRIWPLYFFAISLGIGIAFITHRPGDATGFIWYLLFAGNLYCSFWGWLANPFASLWTISIEEQFYLLWPWAMRFFSRRGLMLCALVFILAANGSLYFLAGCPGDSERFAWASTLVQFEMFATGILLALSSPKLPRNRPGFGVVLALAGPLLWFAANYRFHSSLLANGTRAGASEMIMRYGLYALGCAALLQGFCMIGPSHIPRWAAYLGKISYGLYVYHLLAVEFVDVLFAAWHGFAIWILRTLLALLLTVAAAILSYAFLESPFLRLKRRFEIVHSRPV